MHGEIQYPNLLQQTQSTAFYPSCWPSISRLLSAAWAPSRPL